MNESLLAGLWISAKMRHPADCSRIMAHRKQNSCDAYNPIFTVGN